MKGHDLSVENEASTTDLTWDILPAATGPDANRRRFLNLMKLALTDLLYENDPRWRRCLIEGWGWPSRAMSMIGIRRLNHLEANIERVLAEEIPGDFIETGVWRGGACIFMKGIIEAYGERERRVFVADSFMGLPKPDVFAVPANTLVVADTFGFHARGPSAGRSLRVEIWAYGRRSPFVPWTGFDPWTAAALARRSLIGWQIGDRLERAGIKPHRWRLRTGQSIFEPAIFEPAIFEPAIFEPAIFEPAASDPN